MSVSFTRPLLPGHYRVLLDPPDDRGDETLVFASESRRIKLKGRFFREFKRSVIPLLDGRHTLAEIGAAVDDLFTREDLEQALSLMTDHDLLREGDAAGPYSPDELTRLRPQLNLFHDFGIPPAELHGTLRRATVAVVGLGGMGTAAALSLGAAGVGTLRLFDRDSITAADTYLAPFITPQAIGQPRVAVIQALLHGVVPQPKCEVSTDALTSDDSIVSAIRDSHFVVCCLDPGQSGLIYKLNRACLRLRMPWISGATSGAEIVVGPLVRPYETACYLCYKMRLVACKENPEDEFALQSFLDRRGVDDSNEREAVVFGSVALGNLLAWEAVKALTGMAPAHLPAQITILDLMTLQTTGHKVLRKPWCPACQQEPDGTATSAAPAA